MRTHVMFRQPGLVRANQTDMRFFEALCTLFHRRTNRTSTNLFGATQTQSHSPSWLGP